ncbi:hypothetical protein G9A89_005715 [Geosiphon pyriformis]|nr:hypothetical protein G9A89_005715 [Geosiphon pyriformis]
MVNDNELINFEGRRHPNGAGAKSIQSLERRTTSKVTEGVKQNFSFTENEQGAVIEPFVNHSEKTICEFLVKNESAIPPEIVEKFEAKQRPPRPGKHRLRGSSRRLE